MNAGTGDLDDLARVLGYRDAQDSRTGIDEAGPDLLVVPFWTSDMCAAVVRAAEEVGGFAADPDDPVPGHEVSLAVISPKLFDDLQNDIGRRIWPQLRSVWPLVDYHGVRDAFVIKYSLDTQTELRLHHDVAQVSASVKLNDGYIGAELDFPRQQFTNADVPVGSLLVWPSLVTHPHQTRPLVSGVKYGLTIWFEIPEQYG
jgi:hypothetical protein